MTCAVAHLMVDECIVVYMLSLVGYHAAITPTLCSLTLELHVKTIACDSVVKGNDVVVEA